MIKLIHCNTNNNTNRFMVTFTLQKTATKYQMYIKNVLKKKYKI